jgi:hypothetical protein
VAELSGITSLVARHGGDPAVALDALAAAAPSDPAAARLYGIVRPVLERACGRAAGPEGSGEAALIARLEERLAEIVIAMEDARAAGDDDRAEALHARYIELATTYAGRLARA